MPAPIRPVQPGDPISAAKFNEVVDALNALGRISGAFPICVSQDSAGVRIELAQQFKAWLFQIEETEGEIPRTTDGVAHYSATRVRLDNADEYAAQEPQHVTLYDPLTRDTPERVLHTDDLAIAIFNADTGRWEIVRDTDGGVTIVRFRTTATLTVGGSAAAVIVKRIDETDVDGDEITVADWSAPGTWYGPAGSQGIACRIKGREVHDILWLEHPKLFAVGYATDVMAGGELPVNITSSWDGAALAGDTEKFYDVAGNYASATPGEHFIARLDPATMKFKIIDGPPGGTGLVPFELYQALVEGASAEAHPLVWDGAEWVVNMAALIVVFDSEYLGPAVTTTRGWATWRSESMRYEIVSLGDELLRFQLTEDCEKGADAEANPIIWDAGGGVWIRDDGVTFRVYDSLDFGPANEDAKGWAVFKPDSGRYEIVALQADVAKIGWFKSTSDHVLDDVDFSIAHYVNGQVCDDSQGTNPHGDTLRFYLHSPSDATCPNVKSGAILPYTTDKTGRRVALGSYLDDYRGASKQHIGSTATIPFGWRLCDGNEGTPDLRSRFLLMAFGDAPNDANFDDQGHGDEIAAAGGARGHNHFDSANQDEAPTAGRLHHYSNLSDDIETDDTELAIKSSPGQTVDTSTVELTVSGSGSISSGYTGLSKAYVGIYDPHSGQSWHQHHRHIMTPGPVAGSDTSAFGCTDPASYDWPPEGPFRAL